MKNKEKCKKVIEWNNASSSVGVILFVLGLSIGFFIENYFVYLFWNILAIIVYLICSFITRKIYWRKIK